MKCGTHAWTRPFSLLSILACGCGSSRDDGIGTDGGRLGGGTAGADSRAQEDGAVDGTAQAGTDGGSSSDSGRDGADRGLCRGDSGCSASAGDGGQSTCGVDAGSAVPAGPPPPLQAGQWVDISPPGLNRPRASVPPYGCMDIHISPCNPYVLYLTTDIEGMWKSLDAGATWKQIGNLVGPVSPGVIQIDPSDPQNMYYIGGVRGASVGFWVSADGGDTWNEPAGFTAKADNSVDGWSNDLYDVKADPADFKHVLVTFHSPWNWDKPAGVLESLDGGTTWTRRMPGADWGTGHSIWFLGNSTTWLLGTQSDGYWRTTDSGTTWAQVSTINMQHGGTAAYVSKSGALYVGALSNILRSRDNGLTFTAVAPQTSDGYYAVIGDGNVLYTQFGNTGGNGGGTDRPYITSSESDGTTWTPYNAQKFSDGPYRMAFDPVNRIVYSANWNAGVWALRVK
jgi:hypothetical protein